MEAMAWLIFRGYFYPRPPRGGRPASRARGVGTKKFLSTPSARRATCVQLLNQRIEVISIHALREEGDPTAGGLDLLGQGFLSTPSARRAT